jgi:hypothetical protein
VNTKHFEITDSEWYYWTNLWQNNLPSDIEYRGTSYQVHMNVVGPVLGVPPAPKGYLPGEIFWVFIRIKPHDLPLIRFDAPVSKTSCTKDGLQRYFQFLIHRASMADTEKIVNVLRLTPDYITECVRSDAEWAKKENK